MGHGKMLTFKLSRIAHGQRNIVETTEEANLQYRAQKMREILLPGVDAATAWAMCAQSPVVGLAIHAERLNNVSPDPCTTPDDPEEWQIAIDRPRVSRGFAVLIPEKWPGLHHLVRYFDLIEKNEAPDTPLLEWLVTSGAVAPDVATKTVERFKKRLTMGRHAFELDPEDAARLKLAAEVRVQLEAEERAKSA